VKSRLMYLYGIVLIVWVGSLYVINSATVQLDLTSNASINGVGNFSGIPSLGSVLIFFSVFGVSRKIPEMLKPTLAGFYLSKPISRTRLFSYSALANTLVYSLLILLFLGVYGAFLSQLFPFHVSTMDILRHILLEMIVFAIYVPLISFLGLTTRSGSFAFLLTFAVWLVAKILALEEMRGFLLLVDNTLMTQIADVIYYILPRSSDISSMIATAKTLGTGANDWSALWTSIGSALGIYLLAILKFRKMDF
jgi:hypothetical protein